MVFRKLLGAAKIIGFPLFILALLLLVLIFRTELFSLFSSVENLEEWMEVEARLSPLVFIALQVLQVVVFIIPGEIPQIAGGYLFGPFLGILYSALGILIGSVINYFLGLALGFPFVYAVLGKKRAERLHLWVTDKKGKAVFFILFLTPGIPKDALCYLAGIAKFGLLPFMGLSFLGRLPGIAGSAFIGGAVAERQWSWAFGIFTIACILLVAGTVFKKEIEKSIDKWIHSDKGGKGES